MERVQPGVLHLYDKCQALKLTRKLKFVTSKEQARKIEWCNERDNNQGEDTTVGNLNSNI